MKGLLIKDIYTLVGQTKFFIILILWFALMPGDFFSSFAIIYCGMLPFTALAYDERAKWDILAAMMPYSPRSITLSKYILGYLGIFLAALLAVASKFFWSAIHHTDLSWAVFLSIILITCLATVFLSINLPIMFKYGTEKGRIAFYIILALSVFLGVGFGSKMVHWLTTISFNTTTLLLLCLGGTILINFLSITASTAFYRQKYSKA